MNGSKIKKLYDYEQDKYRRQRKIRKFNERYGEGAFDVFVNMLREGATLQKIGDSFGFTRERARQIRNMLCSDQDLGRVICDGCGLEFVQLNLSQRNCSSCSQGAIGTAGKFADRRDSENVFNEARKIAHELDVLRSASKVFKMVGNYRGKEDEGNHDQGNCE